MSHDAANGISVLLLVRNDRPFVRDCLDRLMKQADVTPAEVLVVDAGSTDGSIDILRENPHVRVVGGTAHSALDRWREAIGEARRPVLAFVDPYMWVSRHHLATLASAMGNAATPHVVGDSHFVGRTPFGRALAHVANRASGSTSAPLIVAIRHDQACAMLDRVTLDGITHGDLAELSRWLGAQLPKQSPPPRVTVDRLAMDTVSELTAALREPSVSQPCRGEHVRGSPIRPWLGRQRWERGVTLHRVALVNLALLSRGRGPWRLARR